MPGKIDPPMQDAFGNPMTVPVPGRTDSEQGRVDQAERRFKEGVEDRRKAKDMDKPAIYSGDPVKRRDTGLHVFQGEVDWVIAKDLDDALAVLAEHYGSPYWDAVGGITEEEAREELGAPLDPDTPLSIWTDSSDWKFQAPEKSKVYTARWPITWRHDLEGYEDGDDYFMVKECAPIWWWIQKSGRGFLCSSEC